MMSTDNPLRLRRSVQPANCDGSHGANKGVRTLPWRRCIDIPNGCERKASKRSGCLRRSVVNLSTLRFVPVNRPRVISLVCTWHLLVLALAAPTVFGQSAQASLDNAAGSPAVTLEEVLAAPDDPIVNLRYAHQLVKEGRLDLAASTLQRILLTDPELDRVRLFYAAVLFRLRNLDQAERELLALKGKALPSDLAEQVEHYIGRIAKERDPLDAHFQFTYGVQYDSNRNSFPTSGTYELNGFPVATGFLQGSGEDVKEEDDFGLLGLATLAGRYDTGHQRAREVFARADVLLGRQFDVTDFNTEAVRLTGGMVYETDLATLIPSVRYDYVRLDGDGFVHDVVGRIRAEHRFPTRRYLGYGEAAIGYREYNSTVSTPFASDRDGYYLEGRVGTQVPINQKTQLDATYRFRYKDAEEQWEAYTSNGIRGRISYTLPINGFVALDALLDRRRYDENAPFTSPSARRDWFTRLQISFGVPLKDLLSTRNLPETLANTVFLFAGTYVRQDSNLLQYDYDNVRLGMYLTTRWDL